MAPSIQFRSQTAPERTSAKKLGPPSSRQHPGSRGSRKCHPRVPHIAKNLLSGDFAASQDAYSLHQGEAPQIAGRHGGREGGAGGDGGEGGGGSATANEMLAAGRSGSPTEYWSRFTVSSAAPSTLSAVSSAHPKWSNGGPSSFFLRARPLEASRISKHVRRSARGASDTQSSDPGHFGWRPPSAAAVFCAVPPWPSYTQSCG